MSLTTIHRGEVDYYQREVTRDLEAYFEGRGEEPGRWLGAGSAAAGLKGTIEEGQLDRLFDQGCHPVTGEALSVAYSGQSDKKTVTGYGLTFSAPKSVSLLWGLGDQEIHRQVRDAHNASVASAITFLEEHAGLSRRGKAGVFQIDTEGLIAAAFCHRTSRADDPHLHTHVLVSAKVYGNDDKWRSLDGRELFGFQKAAGGVYQAALRAELSTRLGVEWETVDRNGQADLIAVPDALVRHFSERRRKVKTVGDARIAEWESRLGRPLSDAEKAVQYQIAAYQTRPAKQHGCPDQKNLSGRWQADAATLGYPAQTWIGNVTGRRTAPAGSAIDDTLMIHAVVEQLDEAHSTWGRAQLAKALAPRLPVDLDGGADAVAAAMSHLCEAILADREVVRLSVPAGAQVPSGLRRRDGDASFERHGAPRYTTRTTLRLEGRVLDAVERGRTVRVGIAFPDLVKGTGEELGDDQTLAVRRLCLGGERLMCVIGPAGTGKTRTLAAAVQAWQQSGIPVRGLAVSAAAAEVLAAETGADCDTLAKLLFEQQQQDRAWHLRRGEVVLVDEASMLPTRQLAALVQLVEQADGKLVLVGDPRQLGAVDAGGLFALLAADPTIAVALTGTRRFQHAWEADATLRLRRQDPAVLNTYHQHGRITGGDRDHILAEAIERWQRARADGQSILLVAHDRVTVDELAARIRTIRVAAGHVQADGVIVGDGQVVGVGDEIITCRNQRTVRTTTDRWIRNGDRWTITGRQADGALTVTSLAGKGSTLLPADYVTDHVTLGYAVTAHKAQGVTVDHGVIIADPTTTSEHLYVGATRGRHANHLLVICETSGDHNQRIPDPLEILTGVLARSSLEQSATQTLRDKLNASEDLALLWPLFHQAWHHIDQAAGPNRDHQLQTLRPAVLAYKQADQQAEQTRDNIGQLQTQLDNATTAQSTPRHPNVERGPQPWQRRGSQEATAHTDTVDRLTRRSDQLTAQLQQAREQLDRIQQRKDRLIPAVRKYVDAHQAVTARKEWLAAHPAEVAWLEDIGRRIKTRTGQLGTDAVANPPQHLRQLLGPVPDDYTRRHRWQQAAGQIQGYLERWRLDPKQLHRHHPPPGSQARNWTQLTQAIVEYHKPTRHSQPAAYPYEAAMSPQREGPSLGL